MPTKPKRKPRGKSAIPSRDNRAFVNQAQHDTQQRQTQAQRRRTVAGLYHAGRTQMEIADELSIAQSTVSEDLKYLREKWTQQAATIVGDDDFDFVGEYVYDSAKTWPTLGATVTVKSPADGTGLSCLVTNNPVYDMKAKRKGEAMITVKAEYRPDRSLS